MATTASLLQTPGIIGVWNYSISNCSAFRDDTVKLFFRVWPETLDGGFTYCCQDGTKNLSLSNFTYGPTQGALDPRPYFDLGAVCQFKNTWKAWTFREVPRKYIYYPLHCDYTDLYRLYVSRFRRHTLPLGVETGILLCVILQALVLIIVWFRNLKAEERKKLGDGWFGQEKRQRLEERFWRSGWADFIADLVHLMLLAVIGDCMMEAVGHSNLHMSRASIMYNAGAFYSYLILLAMVSSFLRQLAMCSDITNTSEDTQESEASDDNKRKSDNLQNAKQSGAVGENNHIPQSIRDSNNHATELNVEDSNSQHEKEQRRIKLQARAWDDAVKGLKDFTDDWRWQRVFGQLGVLALMGTYLVSVDDDTGSSMDHLAGIVVAAVVAASIWSAASATVVAFRALWLMLLMSTTFQRLMISRIKTFEKHSPPPDQGDHYARQTGSSSCYSVSDPNCFTLLGSTGKAADLTISESRISRIKEDGASHSRQKDMPTASVASKSRVAAMLESRLAQLRSLHGKLEENLRGDPSMSDDGEIDDPIPFISRWEAVSQVDLERMEEGVDDFILQERSLPELNPTFPVGSKHAPHSQFSGAVMHEKEKDQNQETSGLESPSYSRIGLPGSQCETRDHLKQESHLSTIGIGDTPENCFQTGIPKMENNSILTMERKGKFEGADSIEFLFKRAEDMSKVVGVGLQWSKVLVTKQFGVVVKHIGEHLWSNLWKETSFSPMRIPIPKPPTNHELSMCNLTPKESSKRFGVGLMGSRLESRCIYVEDDRKQTGEMFPFIFELAEKMGLSENVKDSNFQHPSGISSEAMEEETNDHGGPLLEILEGGESDQGDISTEPMDPMDVRESSQGGNSGEPMEGVESGQGGPSSGPTEVGGQRDQQSSPFQLRFESLQAKGPQDSNENKSLTVIVIPEVGGTFYEGLSNRQVQPDCRIKGAAIAPWLKFKFEILGGEHKITTTTETACDLGGGQLRLHEDWNLAYCHDNITISLTCADPQAVRVSPGTVVAMDVMKRTMTETSTGSTSRANQVSGQASVQVQIPVVPIGVQAQGTLDVTDTIEDSRTLALTIESSNTQFAGFDVNEIGCASSLIFSFVYPEEIVDVMARGQKQFICAGISKTLWPSIVGKWIPLDREEACLYTFKTDQNIYSIGSLRRSHAERKEPILFMQQRYEVPFFINHAMSHIHYYENIELQGPGVQSLDKVLTKCPEI